MKKKLQKLFNRNKYMTYYCVTFYEYTHLIESGRAGITRPVTASPHRWKMEAEVLLTRAEARKLEKARRAEALV